MAKGSVGKEKARHKLKRRGIDNVDTPLLEVTEKERGAKAYPKSKLQA